MRRPAPGARERAQREPAVARPRRERHVRDGARGRVRVGRRLDDLRGALRVFSQTSDGRTRGARRGADARARRLAAKARDDAKRLQRRGAQRFDVLLRERRDVWWCLRHPTAASWLLGVKYRS